MPKYTLYIKKLSNINICHLLFAYKKNTHPKLSHSSGRVNQYLTFYIFSPYIKSPASPKPGTM